MKLPLRRLRTLSLLITGTTVSVACQTQSGAGDRTVLPITDAEYPAITELDARNAEAPPPFSVEAPWAFGK